MATLALLRRGGLLGLLALPGLAQGQVTLAELRTQWQQHQYQAVVSQLRQYRQQPYGRNVEVDYMLATSLCQLPGSQPLAARRFDWMLQNYSLAPPTRRAILSEQASCARTASGSAGAPAPTYNITVTSVRSTGLGGGYVGGKSFYRFTGAADQDRVVSEPAEALVAVPEKEFDQRKIACDQQDAAPAQLKSLLDTTSRQLGGRRIYLSKDVYRGQYAIAHTAHFLVVGPRSEEFLGKAGLELEAYLRFYQQAYGMRAPTQFLTVYVALDAGQLRDIARVQHGIQLAAGAIGYSFQNDLSMAAIMPFDGQGTAKHELFHLLCRSDFGDIPPWLDEGMAALYEVSARTDAGIKGLPNWRGRVLYAFSRKPDSGQRWAPGGQPADSGFTLPVRQLIALPWDRFDGNAEMLTTNSVRSPASYRRSTLQQQAYTYAVARYFALFLQDKGALPAVYQAFRQRDPDLSAPSGRSEDLLAATLHQPLPEIEQQFNQWLVGVLNAQRAPDW